ncbi:MFS transporter [Limibacillus sp. MBR-115]|uniref:MFS transporter n=1 Tax=Limibacillus sp. MBR-115 TaxID=3156465 RepID=UPI003393F86F
MSSPFPHDPIPHTPVTATPDPVNLTTSQQRRGLIALMASILAAGLTFGTGIPLIALILEKQGVSGTVIGLNSATPILATLFVAWVLPRSMRHLRTFPILMAGFALIIVSYLAMPALPYLAAWFPLRFLTGLGMAVHWVVSETWLNAVVKEERRSLMTGIYATMLGLGFAGGPLLLTFIGTDGWTPFLFLAGSITFAAIPLIWARDCIPTIEVSHESSGWQILLAAPTLFAAVFCSGLMDSAILSFLPIYGIRNGLDQDTSILLLSVAIAGTVALQIPLGFIADKVNRRMLLMACGAVGLLGSLALPWMLSTPWLLWPVVFIWGGVFVGLYTLSLAMLGQRFKGGALPAANGLFVMLYAMGSLSGPPLSGTMMDVVGPGGLPTVLATSAGLFLILGIARSFSSSSAR